jgi:AcrR family transcriptional regulator
MSKVHRKQAQRRADILKNVQELLKHKSFEAITVQEICTASNISIGNFYHYFNQKSDLPVGLMENMDSYMSENVFPFLKNINGYDDLKSIGRGFAAHIEQCGLEMSKLISGASPTNYSLDREKRPLYKKIVEIIAKGQSNGEFRISYTAEKTADLLLIAISGLATDWSRRDGNYSLPERMEEFTDLFLPALLRYETIPE